MGKTTDPKSEVAQDDAGEENCVGNNIDPELFGEEGSGSTNTLLRSRPNPKFGVGKTGARWEEGGQSNSGGDPGCQLGRGDVELGWGTCEATLKEKRNCGNSATRPKGHWLTVDLKSRGEKIQGSPEPTGESKIIGGSEGDTPLFNCVREDKKTTGRGRGA